MSWKLSKPNVTLAVTRFQPDKPVAGLTDDARAAHREKRKRETRKFELTLVSSGRPL